MSINLKSLPNDVIAIICLPVVVVLFVLIGEIASILPWIVFGLIGAKLSDILFRHIRFRASYWLYFIIISIIGLLICVDNHLNFGTLSGFAIDDEHFFAATKSLIGQGSSVSSEFSVYSFFLSAFAFPISIFKKVTLSDLLPINWVLSALIAILIDKLSFLIFARNIPRFILIFSYVLHHLFFDTVTRLYRDSLLLFLLLVVLINILKNKNLYALLFLFPLGALRLGNTLLPFLFWLHRKISFKKQWITIALSTLLIASSLALQPIIIKYAVQYGSEITRVDRYVDAFSRYSPEELQSQRFQKKVESENALRAKSYSDVSVASILIRGIFMYFYPLTMHTPNSFLLHGKYGAVKGFYLFHIIKWFHLIGIIIITPLLLIGIVRSLQNQNQLGVAPAYLTFAIFVLLISGQSRHMCGAFLFHPIFASYGHELVITQKRFAALSYATSFGLLMFIALYNVVLR